MAQSDKGNTIISATRDKYAPDKRTEVFDIEQIRDANSITLKGETTSKKGYAALIAEYNKSGENVKDSIRLLPDASLGDKTWGVIYNSAGTIHFDRRYGSETVSQALMGTPVRILQYSGGWSRIQTPDKYIGWISGSVEPMTEEALKEYLKKPKIVITSFYAKSFEKPEAGAYQVSDLVAGDMLELKGHSRKYYRACYPDGREAYVLKTDAAEERDWLKNIHLTEESVLNVARQFSGVPYVWGGTSAKGVDCSGFTKSVYFLHGIILARDASQQVKYGTEVDPNGRFEGLQKGDLMFFGTKPSDKNPEGRVVHVAIYLGNKRFIHASDYIRVSSFDKDDPLFDEYNTNRYLRARRIIGAVNTPGVDQIYENEFYKK